MKEKNLTVEPICFKKLDVVNENGQTIQILDIWLALKVTSKVLGYSLLFSILAGFITSMLDFSQSVAIFMAILVFVPGLFFAYRVYNSYNQGIIVSSKFDKINFPASDVENSLMDIITLKKIRDLANRVEFSISEIDKVWVDRQRRRITYTDRSGKKNRTRTKTIIVYTVNIAGSFGSENIEFTSRQKRDELRSAISLCAKDLGISLCVGANIDMQ